MSAISIGKISDGVYHIWEAENPAPSYLRRYGLVSIPEKEESVEAIPGFSFECGWSGWEEELTALEKSHPIHREGTVIGAPEGEKTTDHAEKAVPAAEHGRFAIRFPVRPGEHFYGLGEGARESLCLNGAVYQNFAKYQADEIPIPFLMSDQGWGLMIVADGRHFVDVNRRRDGWLRCLGCADTLDVIVFQAGTMASILEKYLELAGKPQVLPRWAYGLTYIAPIFTNQAELLRDAEKMRELGIPCHHFSLEPGWMDKFYDMSTDKKWALERFHMPVWWMDGYHPETFIGALRRMGIHLSLWICVDYDLTDEAEHQAGGRSENAYEPWYQHLSKLVGVGIDGFKLDPANMVDPYLLKEQRHVDPDGICSNGEPFQRMHNLNQPLLAKQVYEGFVKQTGKRPMLHYCGGYTGIQRWCAATTGDNGGNEGSMIWLQNLALSGHSNTTVDMDLFDPASMHYAFFAPWAHLNAWQGVLQPWYAGEKPKAMFIRYARLRDRLLPYLYSAALQAHVTGLPMIRPMPLAFEDCKEAAEIKSQYLLGDFLMPGCFTNTLFLPGTGWLDAWSGAFLSGGQTVSCQVPEEWGGSLLIREGAVIPEQDEKGEIFLHLFPGRESVTLYTFYEDDGESVAYLEGAIGRTEMRLTGSKKEIRLEIGSRQGIYEGKPERRIWHIVLHDERKLTVHLNSAEDGYAMEKIDCYQVQL